MLKTNPKSLSLLFWDFVVMGGVSFFKTFNTKAQKCYLYRYYVTELSTQMQMPP